MSIYAIWGPPNSGKTTLTIDLAHALSKKDKSVCIISPEPYSELSARMNLNIPYDKSLIAASKTNESLKQVVYRADELIYVLAVPCFNDPFKDDLNSDDAKSILWQAKALFDYVLVDCTYYATDATTAWALSTMSDKVILLSGSQAASNLWYKSFRSILETSGSRFLPVCVMTCDSFDYANLHNLIGYTPEVWIPYFKDADAYLNIKCTLYRSGGRSGKSYSYSIDNLCTKLEGGSK